MTLSCLPLWVAVVIASSLAACNRDTPLPGPGGEDAGDGGGDAGQHADGAGGLDASRQPDSSQPIVSADMAVFTCGALWTTKAPERAAAPPQAALDPPEGLTVEAWVYPTAAPANQPSALVAHWNEATMDAGYQLLLGPNHEILLAIGYGNKKAALVASRGAIPLGQWSHVAGVVDTATMQISIFINGRLDVATALLGMVAPAPNQGIDLAFNPKQGSQFVGYLTEVRISHGARYVQSFPPDRRFTDDPYSVALYHFAEVGTVVARDSSHVHNDAQVLDSARISVPPSCP